MNYISFVAAFIGNDPLVLDLLSREQAVGGHSYSPVMAMVVHFVKISMPYSILGLIVSTFGMLQQTV